MRYLQYRLAGRRNKPNETRMWHQCPTKVNKRLTNCKESYEKAKHVTPIKATSCLWLINDSFACCSHVLWFHCIGYSLDLVPAVMTVLSKTWHGFYSVFRNLEFWSRQQLLELTQQEHLLKDAKRIHYFVGFRTLDATRALPTWNYLGTPKVKLTRLWVTLDSQLRTASGFTGHDRPKGTTATPPFQPDLRRGIRIRSPGCLSACYWLHWLHPSIQ